MWPYLFPPPGSRTPRALAKPNRWSTAAEEKDAPGERTSGESVSSAMTILAPIPWSPDQRLTVFPSPHSMCRRRARCGHGFVHYRGNRGRVSPEQGRDLCLDSGQRRGCGVRCLARSLPDPATGHTSLATGPVPTSSPSVRSSRRIPNPSIFKRGLPFQRFMDLRLDVFGGGNFSGGLLPPAPLPRLPRGGHIEDGSSSPLAFLGPSFDRLGQLGHRG